MILANITHPVFIVAFPLWAAPIVGGGLLMEAWIARLKFQLSWRSTFVAIVAVNLVSAILAVPLLLVGRELLHPLEDALHLQLTHGYRDFTGAPSLVVAYVLTTIINTGVETAMLMKFWNVPASLRPFRWWLLANGISNGLVFAAFIALLVLTTSS